MNKYLKILCASSVILGQYTQVSPKAIIRQLSAVDEKKTRKQKRSIVVAQSNLSKLNPLVFQPTNTPQGTLDPITKVCKRIEKGCYLKNHARQVTINDKLYNLSCQIPSGIKGKICIYVSGYSGKMSGSHYRYKGSGASGVYRYISNNFMPNVTWISFDGPVNYRKTFNFGQHLDQSCLHEIYTEVIRCNPDADIIFVGLCKGATTILNYLRNPKYANGFHNVKAIILESPLVSFESCTKKIARTKMPKPLRFLLPGFFKVAFPNYEWNQPTILDEASYFPAHIKVFIGCSHHDSVASCKDAHKITSSLKDLAISVELFEQHDKTIKHALLTHSPDYQVRVENFLRQA